VWAINTHPSHARYLSWSIELHTWLLRAISFLTQAFLNPLWVCEILVLDSSVLELCGTTDSLSKRHWLVTHGGCHLLDGLEEWKQWALQEDCEGGLVFLWVVLCLPRQSGEEQLYWNGGLERFKVLISLKVKLLFCQSFLLVKCTLDREENQSLESTSMWIRGDRQITETTEKIVSLLLSCLIICWLPFLEIELMHVT
jgi:hypothetical protein